MKAKIVAFKLESEDSISSRVFYFFIAMSTIWGLVMSAIAASISIKIGFHPSTLAILGLGLLIPLVGIGIAKSENKFLVFIGYNFIVIPFGLILGPLLNKYSPDVLMHVATMTAGITLFMGVAGILLPQLFSKLGGALFIALIGLIVVRVVQIFVPALQQLKVVDYISAGIFSLYIGYDMYCASVMPKTIANAISVSINLYLDIVNLLLSLLASSDND